MEPILLMNELEGFSPMAWLSLVNGLLFIAVVIGCIAQLRQRQQLRRLQAQFQLHSTRPASRLAEVRAKSEPKYPSYWQPSGGTRLVISDVDESGADPVSEITRVGEPIVTMGETEPQDPTPPVSTQGPAEVRAPEKERTFRERLAMAIAGRSLLHPGSSAGAQGTACESAAEREEPIPPRPAGDMQPPLGAGTVGILSRSVSPPPVTDALIGIPEVQDSVRIEPGMTGTDTGSAILSVEKVAGGVVSAEEERLRELMAGVRGRTVNQKGAPGREPRVA